MPELSEDSCENLGMRRTCTLMITHQCNLNCTYCYETHKSDKQMPIQLAKELVKKEFAVVASDPRFSELQIDFIGGEPLIRFDMIKELAEWVWAKPWPHEVPYLHFATTNGTLLNDSMKSWFANHQKQFFMSLSLDGSPETQEKNRRGSFSRIDLEFFRRLWPGQHVKMTLSRESLSSLAADVIYLHEAGFLVSFNPANGILWNDDDASTYESQLNMLATYYLEHPAMTPASVFTISFVALLDNNPVHRKYCGTGNYMVTYDVDGTAYPCHMFTPIVMGEDRSDDLRRFDFESSEQLVDPICRTCPILKLCPTCYGFNYKYRNHIALRDMDLCRMFKRQINVAHRYQLELLMRNGGPVSNEDMVKAKALVHANDILQDFMA